MGVKGISDIISLVSVKNNKTMVIANGVDYHSLEAGFEAIKAGIVNVVLTGNKLEILNNCAFLGIDVSHFEIIDCPSPLEAVTLAVQLAKNGNANIIMKGLIGTDIFMKAILNKEHGLIKQNSLATHITLIDTPNYHKPLLVSDVAIIPLPSYEQKIEIVKALIDVSHKLGEAKPKVAFIAATEQIIEKMPACSDAAKLTSLWEKEYFKNSICCGPMALDLALDKEAALIKQYTSPVAGDADCLLFPNIESGNVFYKTNTKLCKSDTAAVVYGTTVPTVLSSRGDSMKTKLNSIALAAFIG